MRRGWSRRPGGRGATAVRVSVILAAVGCCLAAAAYATTRRADPEEAGGRVPLRPIITVRPEPVTSERVAEFDFSQPPRPPSKAIAGQPLGFECRLDEGAWEECERPVTLRSVPRGTHRFTVRAVNSAGTQGPAATAEWQRVRKPKPAGTVTLDSPTDPRPTGEPTPTPTPTGGGTEPPVEPVEPVEPPPTQLPFTIEQIGELEPLLPGAPAQTIAVRIENPNSVAISVTSLTAAIATDPPDCPALENFVLAPAAIEAGAPVIVPAESTLGLPAAGVAGPTIAMLDLPTNQDACQASELQIDLSGEATE